MSYFSDRLFFFQRSREPYADGHGITTNENRGWEESYRQRWQHDKIVRSTHGVNCTGSCSWKIYVKGGIVTWETQYTDYPRTRPEMPNHEPRGCSRGASYSWYLYSGNRLKYPMVRKRLLQLWRSALKTNSPVEAWASIVDDPELADSYKRQRGRGGFVRSSWDEVNQLIAAANIHTIRRWGPDRVIGFSPIPAMSMVSYAAGTRYLSLIGGVCMSFYDWYCDLPPSSPQTWGEQTDVPESADWYNSTFLILWGSNVPQTRTPDAHFYTEARYRGAQSVVVSPDYSEAAKFSDIWLHPKQGTDSALAMAMGHVILREFHLDGTSEYFQDYVRRYTDFPMLVCLKQDGENLLPERFLRASDLEGGLGETNHPEWKTVAIDEQTGEMVTPVGSIGFRWDGSGKWNLEEKNADDRELKLQVSLLENNDGVASVAFPYFGGRAHAPFAATDHSEVLHRNVPVKQVSTVAGTLMVTTVFDLFCANYGLDRGLGGDNVAVDFNEDVPYTPAWQEPITGVPAEQVITVARAFASNADKTRGRSMVIVGAGLNHWYHMDMMYRSIINMLVMCGCIGQSGGGWSHYVGQEKLRPQTGWLPLAFSLDWYRPPRQMNSTSFWYAHSDQWRYENLSVPEILSPTAPSGDWSGSLIDYNIRSERMGWLPSAPQLNQNPLEVAEQARQEDQSIEDYVVQKLKSRELAFACETPDAQACFPRNLFVWRSNLLGASSKGHEYFLKHLIGAKHGVQCDDLGEQGKTLHREVEWVDEAPEGKLDLLCTIDFRMSTTCLYSDVVLPTATWYEKNDLNTTDMHPFIHPLSTAVDPVWESRSDWEVFKGIAKNFSELAGDALGEKTDVVLLPILHDTPMELAQATAVQDWKRGEVEPIPGRTMPKVVPVRRNYGEVYNCFTSVGPLLEKLGNGGKGISWNTTEEVQYLKALNGEVEARADGARRAKIDTDIQAAEFILALAPETNGEVAVKAWTALSKTTGREHSHLARPREDDKLTFRDLQAQPRKIISSPIWSGLESEQVSYNAGYTNVHELIPWRTLTGRQQLYQDHLWMRAFGEQLCVYKPPVDLKAVPTMKNRTSNGNPEIVLSFITPHQKWGIHSTYTDNLLMLTLSRGGPIIWISETDAKSVDIEDNDWIEAFNANGALTARAVVSQRIKPGMAMMYHAQEKIVNVPGSEITGTRGGIHNSVTRTVPKPTHMIGGYAHQSYGFNYYGTVGSNRDEFIVVRKMAKVDWLDAPVQGAAMRVQAGASYEN